VKQSEKGKKQSVAVLFGCQVFDGCSAFGLYLTDTFEGMTCQVARSFNRGKSKRTASEARAAFVHSS
jgi:hypothetical protein